MTTMTDEEAFALGVRAVKAGFKPVRGCKDPAGNMLLSRIRTTGLSMDVWDVRVGQNIVYEFAPDLRDPGTKGHAVAQLRERTGDHELSTRCDFGEDESGARWVSWYVGSDEHGGLLTQAPVPCPTEEEAIVAAFEATKETP